MRSKSEFDINNYLAIEMLELLDVENPTQRQIDIMSSIVANVTVKSTVFFDNRLTTREKSCLYWAAKGKSASETAGILNIKKETVDTYRKGIIYKLGCRNITQAVFEGVRLNVFESTSTVN